MPRHSPKPGAFRCVPVHSCAPAPANPRAPAPLAASPPIQHSPFAHLPHPDRSHKPQTATEIRKPQNTIGGAPKSDNRHRRRHVPVVTLRRADASRPVVPPPLLQCRLCAPTRSRRLHAAASLAPCLPSVWPPLTRATYHSSLAGDRLLPTWKGEQEGEWPRAGEGRGQERAAGRRGAAGRGNSDMEGPP